MQDTFHSTNSYLRAIAAGVEPNNPPEAAGLGAAVDPNRPPVEGAGAKRLYDDMRNGKGSDCLSNKYPHLIKTTLKSYLSHQTIPLRSMGVQLSVVLAEVVLLQYVPP